MMEFESGIKLFGFMIFPTIPPQSRPLQQLQPTEVPPQQNQHQHLEKIEPSPEFTPKLREVLLSIGVSKNHNPTHIYTKKLFESDINKGLNRFTIPRNGILTTFLGDQEEALLRGKDKLDVTVVDPSLAVHKLNLSRWNYKQKKNRKSADPSYSYALVHGWNDIVKGNGLDVGDTVQIWSFRFNGGSIGFIIFRVQPGFEPGSSDGSSTSSCGGKRKRGSHSSLSTVDTV